ncbi:MAG TPA: SRPBCC domain-containing protein [Bryobacteraceae bacterium]|nr:SRPBCC domain-containing protein [Bryobacteraceae bacterium]
MSVKKEANGRRSISVEVEVPGTPEEVWDAIATGPGISKWFVPAQVEPRAGGKMVLNFGPGMDSESQVTSWDAPRRFTAASEGLGPNAPEMATEWTVEARSGGTCIVRVVHSLFADTDEWDNQLGEVESGWPSFFVVLRMYLSDYRGQPGAHFQVMAPVPGTVIEGWRELLDRLGLPPLAAGVKVQSRNGTAPLAGVVEKTGPQAHPNQVIVRLDEPTPGAALLSTCGMGGQTFFVGSFYFFGPKAKEGLTAEKPWQDWLGKSVAAS